MKRLGDFADAQGSKRLPPPALRISRTLLEACAFVRQSSLDHCVVSGSRNTFRLGSLTGSLTLSIAYGVNIESESNKFFSASEDAMAAVDVAMLPGSFLVDVFPIRMNFSRKGHSQRSLQCYFPQSNMSRNGFLELVSRHLQGRPRRTSMIPLPLRSNMLKNRLRFANLSHLVSPSVLLERISGGDSYHFLGCGGVFGGTTRTFSAGNR